MHPMNKYDTGVDLSAYDWPTWGHLGIGMIGVTAFLTAFACIIKVISVAQL